jgi:hypothetical protein
MLLFGNGLWPPLRIANGHEFLTSVLVIEETSCADDGVIMQFGFALACKDQYELVDDS